MLFDQVISQICYNQIMDQILNQKIQAAINPLLARIKHLQNQVRAMQGQIQILHSLKQMRNQMDEDTQMMTHSHKNTQNKITSQILKVDKHPNEKKTPVKKEVNMNKNTKGEGPHHTPTSQSQKRDVKRQTAVTTKNTKTKEPLEHSKDKHKENLHQMMMPKSQKQSMKDFENSQMKMQMMQPQMNMEMMEPSMKMEMKEAQMSKEMMEPQMKISTQESHPQEVKMIRELADCDKNRSDQEVMMGHPEEKVMSKEQIMMDHNIMNPNMMMEANPVEMHQMKRQQMMQQRQDLNQMGEITPPSQEHSQKQVEMSPTAATPNKEPLKESRQDKMKGNVQKQTKKQKEMMEKSSVMQHKADNSKLMKMTGVSDKGQKMPSAQFSEKKKAETSKMSMKNQNPKQMHPKQKNLPKMEATSSKKAGTHKDMKMEKKNDENKNTQNIMQMGNQKQPMMNVNKMNQCQKMSPKIQMNEQMNMNNLRLMFSHFFKGMDEMMMSNEMKNMENMENMDDKMMNHMMEMSNGMNIKPMYDLMMKQMNPEMNKPDFIESKSRIQTMRNLMEKMMALSQMTMLAQNEMKQMIPKAHNMMMEIRDMMKLMTNQWRQAAMEDLRMMCHAQDMMHKEVMQVKGQEMKHEMQELKMEMPIKNQFVMRQKVEI